jgi:translation initiation factor IF-2
MDIPPEMLSSGAPISARDLQERLRQEQQPPSRTPPTSTPGIPLQEPEGEEDEGRPQEGKKRGSTGGVAGRAERHKERSERQKSRVKGGGEDSRGRLTLTIDEESPRHRKDRLKKRPKPPGTVERKGKVPVSVPITVRSLSEAIGKRSGDMLFKLMAHGAAPTININSPVEPDMAETVALDYGIELDIKRGTNTEQDLIDSSKKADKPEDLEPRAPIVAIMGHVDHGKTTLLDKIRQSNVAAGEVGGITQVIRAWRVESNGQPITFLDTPGHEAFTKMRARGAHVTDIVVIVVAADDGVMPQTEEAINHSKAAGVSLVVAINKIDLPNANVKRTEQQLYSLSLLPDNMGGDVPFVYTSAAKGEGIDDLLENILVVAELKELRANPHKPASGTCLEAHLSEREGVLATLLIQDGTLHTGDHLLCGATYGTVRRMYDDLGRTIHEAGPSVPVRITGLDEVPDADDPFMVVPDLAMAREVAEKRKEKLLGKALHVRTPVTLENLKEAEIAELKVILKAEARGSIEAIRAELEKLHHEEVRVRILHTGIGGITTSDVHLALTSPQDTLIVGFNVVPDNEARALADERGIQIRQYNIIYQLADDIKAALEGKLKPREEIIHLGRAVVRETFKISRVGTIAGCYVTQGVIERNAKVRVIRGGVVVYPPAERTVGLESLKRFKDDVREVREGFECGLKVAGYDDIKVDDVIECYRIEQVQRTL